MGDEADREAARATLRIWNGCDGSVTAEFARRQDDGTWLWVADRFSVA